MSTPARKSGRQAKPTEKFKEYLYGSDEREVPSKIGHTSSTTVHIQSSKEKPSTDAIFLTTVKKRGRPRKSILEVDPLKIKTNNPEIEDEEKFNYTKGNKIKKSSHGEGSFEPEPECDSSTMTDTDSEDEDHSKNKQEYGPRRSGRPPKLNKRLLSYLRSDEGPFGESGHLSKKRKGNSEILSKKIKKFNYFQELENTKDHNVIPQIEQPMPVNHELRPYDAGPVVKCVQNTSIRITKEVGRMKSLSPEKLVRRLDEGEKINIKKTMISKLEELSKKMLDNDTNHFLKLASEESNDLDDPFLALHLENNTEDLDDKTSENVLKWLGEEELERQRYRRKLLESLKKSHENSMDTFKQMLKALETV